MLPFSFDGCHSMLYNEIVKPISKIPTTIVNLKIKYLFTD